jgi:hypothetical protein
MLNYTILSNLFETVLFYQIFVFIVVILEGKKPILSVREGVAFVFLVFLKSLFYFLKILNLLFIIF